MLGRNVGAAVGNIVQPEPKIICAYAEWAAVFASHLPHIGIEAAGVSLKICAISITPVTSHRDRSRPKTDAPLNVSLILVMEDTSHHEISSLKSATFAKALSREVATFLDKSQSAIGPYRATAVLLSAIHKATVAATLLTKPAHCSPSATAGPMIIRPASCSTAATTLLLHALLQCGTYISCEERNICSMFVTLETSHDDRSALKVRLPSNK
jgi:hypothetical protein